MRFFLICELDKSTNNIVRYLGISKFTSYPRLFTEINRAKFYLNEYEANSAFIECIRDNTYKLINSDEICNWKVVEFKSSI